MGTKDEDIVMVIDKPHFKVVLYKSLLKLDLKEGIRSDLEMLSNPEGQSEKA